MIEKIKTYLPKYRSIHNHNGYWWTDHKRLDYMTYKGTWAKGTNHGNNFWAALKDYFNNDFYR